MNYLKNNYPLLLLFLLNVLVKCLFLTSESISHDEPFSIFHAQFDLPELIAYLKNYNNPPLYEILLHAWIKASGISEFSVRFMPMLFSCFSVIFIYKIGKEFFNSRIALLSSLVFTFSTMQTLYAHDSRVYSLFLLLTAISFYLFFRLLAGRLSKSQTFLFMFINVLSIYAHYFGFFIWFIQFLIVIAYHLKNKHMVRWYFFIHALGIILYSPQIITLYQRFSESSSKGTWLKAPIGVESLYNMIWSFSNAPIVSVLTIVILTAGLVKYAVLRKEAINHFTTAMVIWFFVPYFFMFFLSYKIPMFLDRYLIFITPAFYILLAIAINYLFEKRVAYLSAAGILTICFVCSFSINPAKKRSVKETVGYIKTKKDPKTLVLICPPEFNTTFAYYYNKEIFRNVNAATEYGNLTNSLQTDNIYFINEIDQNLIHKINPYEKIIYLDAGADFAVPGNKIKNDLFQRFKLMEERKFPEIFQAYTFIPKNLTPVR
jgi:mannosyltransferase